MTPALLDILCSPGSNEPLSLEGGWLVDSAGRRWPLVEGIPILLPDGVDTLPGRSEIIEASRTRSVSYYQDNYVVSGNSEREVRRCAVTNLLGLLVQRGSTILEVGSGPATLADEIQALTTGYVALDLSLDNLLAGRERIGELDAVVGDLTAMPVSNSAVDVVVAVGCLEYVAELPRAIRELCRVVKPAGVVIASFANRRSPRRFWDERVILPAVRLLRSKRNSGSIYRRYLHAAGDIAELFRDSDTAVRELRYLNPGLLGFPLSELASLRRVQTIAARRVPTLGRLGSEFLIVASKR
jgi:ubiquinone/menaquinone biosynthesis C-methylase UbiE/uncharacterized protein YbaR (Trm112 family)